MKIRISLRRLLRFIVIALALCALCHTGTSAETETAGKLKLNAEGVLALLDVMDAVAALHPDFEEKAEQFRAMTEDKLESELVKVRERNEGDEVLQSAIETMLDTGTYQIYFRRFRNVTPELARDLLLDLPYRERSAPGGIGGMYRELLRKRTMARKALDRLLAQVDLEWVYDTAERWVPEGEREPLTMYLIYDSNAGSFTAGGVPFFNIYTDLELETLSSDVDGSALLEAQGTMAHELQHVFARPYLYPPIRKELTWQQTWVERITRGMVSEGVAIHCNPPSGAKKEIYEDESVLAALVNRLNEMLVSLGKDETSEEEVQEWYRANYHAVAKDLLRQHLAKRYSGDEMEAKMREHMSLRPDMEHVLGWWMVSRISGAGERSDDAIALLGNPSSLFELYNEACGDGPEALQLSPEVLVYLESIYD